jgi:predicted HD superfamily hydrolase involved in NAD metabolism
LGEFLARLQNRVLALPAGLQAHIHRVRGIAEELAAIHGVDPPQAALGALAHDVARAMPDRQLLIEAARLKLPVGLVDRRVPLLLHGPVGAQLLRDEDGLTDRSIYRAVYWHTTAHPSLDALGRVVFLADKLDPQKLPRYPYQPYLKELARESLDAALLEFLTRELVSLAGKGDLVHPVMVEARNHLLAAGSQARTTSSS